jgi:hypothetical protein
MNLSLVKECAARTAAVHYRICRRDDGRRGCALSHMYVQTSESLPRMCVRVCAETLTDSSTDFDKPNMELRADRLCMFEDRVSSEDP